MNFITVTDLEFVTHWVNFNNVVSATELDNDCVEIIFIGDFWIKVTKEEWERVLNIIQTRERRK